MGLGGGVEKGGMKLGWEKERAEDLHTWHFHLIALSTSSQEGAKDKEGVDNGRRLLLTTPWEHVATFPPFALTPALSVWLPTFTPVPPLLYPQNHPTQSVTPFLWNPTHPAQLHTNFMHALVTHTCRSALAGSEWGGGGRRPEENHTFPNASAEQGHAAMGADSLHFYWCSSLMLSSPTFHHHLSTTIYLGRFCSRFKVTTLLVV